ncbi:Ac-type transposase, partial [Stereum hirsutum FP-91666 SS1]
QKHSVDFPVLSLIARDILAIPGVSVAVERLFSHCRQTMTELRSSMASETAAKAVVSKDLLKEGVGKEL